MKPTRITVTSALIAMGLSLVGAAPGVAGHGDNPSAGTYRIAYADGTEMRVTADAHDHGGVNGNKDRVDLAGDSGILVVAAASGVVRWVDDHNGEDYGRGDGLDNYGGAQDDSLEHSCQDDEDMNGNNIPNSVVTGLCQDYNNYVWIEHPNGEWTKYTHLRTGTASIDYGWTIGEPVEAGDVLGEEGDIGAATGPHLHWEVGVPTDPTDDTPFSTLGGFLQGSNRTPVICDIAGNRYVTGAEHVANPCVHAPPVADAGGPYVVAEGSEVVLDGSGSSDGDGGASLTYLWDPQTFADGSALDDVSLADPTFSAVEGPAAHGLTLTVFDQVEQLDAADDVTVTVTNVAPTVTATGDAIDEASTATVSATFTDPGTLDTHTASIDWGDGGAAQAVTPAQLASGVDHVYGDNGTYAVEVTVTDDDGGAGQDTVDVVVANLDPSASIDVGDAVSFPGGDYLVVESGQALGVSADATDPGSDDLTFTWDLPDVTTFYNDGVGPEPLEPPTPTPFGTFPFAASDGAVALFAAPGVETVGLVVSDDDGGSAEDAAGVIVTGTEDDTRGSGWWKHQYSGTGSPHIDPDLTLAYLEIVSAVSGVFSEQTPLLTAADAHAVLSPGGDRRDRARSELLQAWLEFASGAVSWDATVSLTGSGGSVGYLDLLTDAETTIADGAATDAELHAVEKQLAAVRHAG
ncbi:PKD domain-containing protein [Humibacillus xanthopallidus]|uniref:M23 family metallopeptidase n=1 Tax=Humibacillus xanthopallidus TaxID=412689 RepID=UPI00384ACD4B